MILRDQNPDHCHRLSKGLINNWMNMKRQKIKVVTNNSYKVISNNQIILNLSMMLQITENLFNIPVWFICILLKVKINSKRTRLKKNKRRIRRIRRIRRVKILRNQVQGKEINNNKIIQIENKGQIIKLERNKKSLILIIKLRKKLHSKALIPFYHISSLILNLGFLLAKNISRHLTFILDN